MITPFSTNAVAACHSAGLMEIIRIEKSQRYLIRQNLLENPEAIKYDSFYKFLKAPKQYDKIFEIFGDRMTQCEYKSIPNFDNIHLQKKQSSFQIIDLMAKNGNDNLIKANTELGLGFDKEDIDFYLEFFRNRLKRNPTDVEIFGKEIFLVLNQK